MVAVSDFSGLTISSCALASAAASVPTLSLDRCMARLLAHDDVKTDGSGFRTFGAEAMARGFLGILRHQRLQFGLGSFMVERGLPGCLKQACKLCPGV